MKSAPRVEGCGQPADSGAAAPILLTVENVEHWCRYQEALLQFRLNRVRQSVGLPPQQLGGQR